MEKTKMTMRGLYMDSKQWEFIDRIAKQKERSANWLTGNIIKEWIKKQSKDRKTKDSPTH